MFFAGLDRILRLFLGAPSAAGVFPGSRPNAMPSAGPKWRVNPSASPGRPVRRTRLELQLCDAICQITTPTPHHSRLLRFATYAPVCTWSPEPCAFKLGTLSSGLYFLYKSFVPARLRVGSPADHRVSSCLLRPQSNCLWHRT